MTFRVARLREHDGCTDDEPAACGDGGVTPRRCPRWPILLQETVVLYFCPTETRSPTTGSAQPGQVGFKLVAPRTLFSVSPPTVTTKYSGLLLAGVGALAGIVIGDVIGVVLTSVLA